MDSDTPQDHSLKFGTIRVTNYFFILGITILYYDHGLTFVQELELIWKRFSKTSWSCHLFLLNRYLSFFGNIVVGISFFYPSFSNASCQGLELFHRIFQVVTQGIVCVVLTVRVCALYGGSRRLLILLLAVILAVFLTLTVIFSKAKAEPSSAGLHGCHNFPSLKSESKIAAGWIANSVYDTVLFSMTLFKTRGVRKMACRGAAPVSLVSIILRDGSMYFGAMVIVSMINVIIVYMPENDVVSRGALNPFVGCVSTTLASRLMLNLHDVVQSGLYSTHVESVYTSPSSLHSRDLFNSRNARTWDEMQWS